MYDLADAIIQMTVHITWYIFTIISLIFEILQ